MKIAVLGATGAVGGHFVNKALAQGHEIHALVRNPEKLEAQKGLTPIKGDATNMDDVRKLIKGADRVVSALGNVKKVLIMEKAANAILEVAREQNTPPKSMFISSIGCGGTSWIVKQMLKIIGGGEGFADYERADARIRSEQSVPYVLIRPSALKEKPGNGKYRVFQGDGTFARPISKEDVAAFLLDALDTGKWDGQGGFQLAGEK